MPGPGAPGAPKKKKEGAKRRVKRIVAGGDNTPSTEEINSQGFPLGTKPVPPQVFQAFCSGGHGGGHGGGFGAPPAPIYPVVINHR